MPKIINYQPTPAESEALAAQHLPANFKGREEISPEIVSAFRGYVQNTNSLLDLMRDRSSAAVMPLITDLKQRVQNDNIDASLAKKFLDEIALTEGVGAVDPLWALTAYFRYAAAISEVSAEEKDLFAHLIYPYIFKGLAGKGFMESSAVIANILSDPDSDSAPGVFSIATDVDNLHYSTDRLIHKELMKLVPPPIFYPFANLGKVGISFLINCYIDQIYVLGLPPHSRPISAHGVPMSPLPFIVHDLLHGFVDPRSEALIAYLSHKAGDYVSKGGDSELFIKWYAPHLARSYNALMTCLRAVNYMLQNYLLPYYGKKEYQKAMVGFFFVMHEYPSYSQKSITDTDLSNFFKQFEHGVKSILSKHEIWASSLDPLDTSPLDGSSSFSDKELIQYAFKHYLCNDSMVQFSSTERTYMYKNLGDDPAKIEIIKKANKREVVKRAIVAAKVLRSPIYIDVEFKLRSGQTLKYAFPTLRHKWLNLDDLLSLLRLAGIVVPKPKIDHLSRAEARKVAKDTLEVVGAHIIATVDHFIDRATNLASRNLLQGKSLTTSYFDWKFKQNTRVEETITKSLVVKTRPRLAFL